jgi:dihydroorotate dehydrogenase (fumarate)
VVSEQEVHCTCYSGNATAFNSKGALMNLTTTYMGLKLANPLMPGASPLADDLDTARTLEDAGASAIVMRSLFEEQIDGESHAGAERFEKDADANEFSLGPEAYLEHICRLKQAVDVPVIASLNGRTISGWLDYARLIELAGADALELNVYHLATQVRETPGSIEDQICEVARAVREAVQLPLAVKLSPFFTSLPHLAMNLRTTGIDGLVLFNRFYQPDIDVNELRVVPQLHLSDSTELLLRLRWLAILSGRCTTSLAACGGVHTATDVIKAVMAGAHAVQIVSVLLRHGPGYIRVLLEQLKVWMEEHEYESIGQMRGRMNLANCPDPAAFERENYMRVLNSWHGRIHYATFD